jgi:hypothetical protein
MRVIMHAQIEPTTYVTRAEELVWGLVLLAFSLTIHGFGMVLTLRATGSFKRRFATTGHLLSGIAIVILGSWMILAVQIVEVAMWAGFFQWKHCFENLSTAVYFTGLQYTTVGSSIAPPNHWRLLEIMVSSAGLMAFAWSTGVLMTLAQDFQSGQLRLARALRFSGQSKADPGVSEP